MTVQEQQQPAEVKPTASGTRKSVKSKRAPVHKPEPSAILAKKIFVIFVFLLAQLLFYFSDFFKLKEIWIYGNQRVSNDEILATASIPLEVNIVTLPLQKFQQKLTTIHWIRDVKVKWAVPGRVNIFVTERTPVILLRQNGMRDKWFAADEMGMVLYEAPPEETSKFPRLIIDDKIKIASIVPDKKVDAARTVDANLPENIRKNIISYLVDNQDEVVILTERMGHPFKIKVGKPSDIKRKMELLAAIMELINEKNMAVTYVDLRFNDPVILPANARSKKKETATPSPTPTP